MDPKRVFQGMKIWAPPGTPLEAFFKQNKLELKEAVRSTQEMLAEGARIFKQKGEMAHSDLAELFGTGEDYLALPAIKLGKKPLVPKIGDDQKPPLPKIPVGAMIQEDAQDYLRDLLTWIFETKKGLKPRQYRKWPLYKDGALLEEATKLDEWDEELEEICPRNFYKGPHKGFERGRGPSGAGAARIVVVCACY